MSIPFLLHYEHLVGDELQLPTHLCFTTVTSQIEV